MPAVQWTAERIDLLNRLWAHGATAQTIAEQLGVSRSAVMGKLFRLRRKKVGAAPASAGANRPSQPAGKSLLQLTNNSCRWPVGEPGKRGFHFCGAPDADLARAMPYCPVHARLAYGPAAIACESDDPAPREPNNEPDADHGPDPVCAAAPAASPEQSRVWRALVRRPAARRR